MTSGRKSPGAPSNTKTKTSAATVPTTSRPVMISFLCNCILASFQNGTFGAAAQELSDDWIGGLLEFVRLGVFDDFSLIQHSHSRADAKGAVHFMGYDNRGDFRFLGQANDQFVDDRRNDWIETSHRFVEKNQFRLKDKGSRQTHTFFHPTA